MILRFAGLFGFALLLTACNDGSSAAIATAASGVCSVSGNTAVAAEDAGRPQTIPALRQWLPASGSYQFGRDTRILLAPESQSALLSAAQVFADDLKAMTGTQPAIVIGTDASRDGDIRLELSACDSSLGEEGYGMTVGRFVEIRAAASAGVFYGTRTLLQLLHQGNAIPAGSALDWPRYPERGLMVDTARQLFPVDWLQQHIRELAWLKMNVLYLHLSDDQGFRIESATHPEIVSARHFTKDELRGIIALAQRYHIRVIPELDMPCHMTSSLASHPELELKNLLGRPEPGKLDVSNPAALQFAKDLIEEYLPLFGGPYWAVGGDECLKPAEYPLYPALGEYARSQYGPLATGRDALLGFFNWADGIVRAHGQITRLWNDEAEYGIAVRLNPGMVIDWWTNLSPLSDTLTLPPQQFIDEGEKVFNVGWFPAYYTDGITSTGFLTPDMKTAYESWSMDKYYGPGVINSTLQIPPYTVAADEPANLGGMTAIWLSGNSSDPPPEAIATGVRLFILVMAQKAWESPLLTPDYDDFVRITATVGNAPGYTFQ